MAELLHSLGTLPAGAEAAVLGLGRFGLVDIERVSVVRHLGSGSN